LKKIKRINCSPNSACLDHARYHRLPTLTKILKRYHHIPFPYRRKTFTWKANHSTT